MMSQSTTSRRPGRDQPRAFSLRLPAPLYKQLAEQASKNRRSMNSEAVYLIEQSLDGKVAA